MYCVVDMLLRCLALLLRYLPTSHPLLVGAQRSATSFHLVRMRTRQQTETARVALDEIFSATDSP